MSKLCMQLLAAFGIAVVASGNALAGDGGDNSMSQWTGDSYRAFEHSRVCDVQPPRDQVARPVYPPAEPSTQTVASNGRRHGERTNPFRDDTAG